MAETPQPHPSSPPASQAAGASRALLLWAALGVGLLFCFLLDTPAMQALLPYRDGSFAHLVRRGIRPLGTGTVQAPLLLLLVLVGWRRGRREVLRAGGWGLFALALSGAVANVLKVLIHRPRPWVTEAAPSNLAEAIGSHHFQSLPSGESAATFAIAASVGLFLPRWRWPLLLVGAIVALARMLLAAHHASDVWAGMMVGLATAQLVAVAARPGAFRAGFRRALPFLLLGVFAAAILLSGLGRLPLFGRDESLYAESARGMYVSGDWVTPRVNGEPFLEKPPLYYWLAAAGYHAVGISPLGARLPSALLGVLTVVLTALLGARLWGLRAGILAGLALTTSLQLALIGRMGIMDVPLMCFTTLGLLAYAAWRLRGGWGPAVAFGLLVALGMVLKGAAGGLAPLVALVHLVVGRRFPNRITVPQVLAALAVFGAALTPYFALVIRAQGASYGATFVLQEHLKRILQPMQGHGGLPVYYLLLILITFFPWVAFLPAALRRKDPEPDATAAFWRSLAATWFWAVLIPFSLIGTKLPGYVTPLFPAMALLVGIEIDRRLETARGAWTGVAAGAAVLAVAVLALLIYFAPKLAARVEAVAEAKQLVTPAIIYACGYALMVVGAVLARRGRTRTGPALILAGQLVAIGVVLGAIVPALAPFQEGGREYRLARLAQRELPDHQLVMYGGKCWPEGVNFALGRPVTIFRDGEVAALQAAAGHRLTAVILPAKKEADLRAAELPSRGRWRVGDYLLLDLAPSGR